MKSRWRVNQEWMDGGWRVDGIGVVGLFTMFSENVSLSTNEGKAVQREILVLSNE